MLRDSTSAMSAAIEAIVPRDTTTTTAAANRSLVSSNSWVAAPRIAAINAPLAVTTILRRFSVLDIAASPSSRADVKVECDMARTTGDRAGGRHRPR
ncbi:hypothetical protein GCM10017556_58890 [Micromonospora sagamiensis]|nr:hypothetical protein GCM10017556_00090 [Micromonospora sagamiensis]BCL18150.1 hypothetical protein GCM10017556_58890 [Micromonospora sagamiensis]